MQTCRDVLVIEGNDHARSKCKHEGLRFLTFLPLGFVIVTLYIFHLLPDIIIIKFFVTSLARFIDSGRHLAIPDYSCRDHFHV